MSRAIDGRLEKLLAAFDRRITAPIGPQSLQMLYNAKNYKGMVQWIQKSMRLDLGVGLSIVDDEQKPPMWIVVPQPMPAYGTAAFRRSYVTVFIRRDILVTKPFEWIVAGLAHELSHVVLFSMDHELQHDEKAVDLTAMILGYQNFISDAEIVKNEGGGALWILTLLLLPLGMIFLPGSRTQTERLGYLTSEEAVFAKRQLARIGYKS